MMTEDEAKKKWCPQVPNRDGIDDAKQPECLCIASECMAWRWSDPEMKFVVTKTRFQIAEEMGVSPNEVEEGQGKHIPFPNRRGYCGIAGPV